MKKQFIFLLCNLGILNLCLAQVNLVPNPSFEDTVNCPFAAGDIDKATGWTSMCGSPDYFNVCNQFDWGAPKNIFGFQQPASGDAYAGFGTYSDLAMNTREFPICLLTNPLTMGTKYYVSFKVALSLENIANPTNCATNKIGAMFTTGIYPCKITNNPPVFTNAVITDSLNWTRISGSFVADSAYTYLVIGNFFDDNNTDTVKYFNSWWSDFAYYYLDDVCLSTDSVFTANYVYTGMEKEQLKVNFNIYPNPVTNYFQINQNFSEPYDLIIYNEFGQQLYQENNIINNKKNIDAIPFGKGILFINIKSGNQSINYKLLKQ